jgi:SNF2 family DNA or RNA helicase
MAKPAGATLLVCPKCILTQWEEELSHKVTKDATLSALVYHGCSRAMDPEELAKYDVVITTWDCEATIPFQEEGGVRIDLI